MSKRKIAESLNIRIRTGDFQHIEMVKYAEEEIEYQNDQERIEKEDHLHETLMDSVMKSLRAIPERTGKGKAEVIEVEQKLSKAIPEWLASDPVPNIANNAKKIFNTAVDKQQSAKEKVEANTKLAMPDEDNAFAKKEESSKEDVVAEVAASKDDVTDLFEEDTIVETQTQTVTGDKAEEAFVGEAKEVKETKKDDGFEDIFGDTEDLFDK